jgi:eukaryotic-like serine/threonine-protein kinase
MMRDDEFESCVLRFEQARRLRNPCEIGDFLGTESDLPAPERARLLVELICIDLEFRWRDSGLDEPITLEGYVERFPELISLDRLPLELIGEEYRVRCQWGDRPSHQDFLARFRDRLELIRVELLEVDSELDRESAPSLPGSQGRLRTSLEVEIAEPDRADLLLSHKDFLLRQLIGAGRMGKVYEALDLKMGRRVAVKFLRKSLLRHPEVVRRFVEESRTIECLRHPNIVGTEGLGRTPGGSYFIVMDLVDGPDLGRIAAQRTIAVSEALQWVMSTCEAIEYAHEQGIIHCDLKPANLLLSSSGWLRVTDFGFARSSKGENPWALELEGTVPFMAPEQASPSWGPIDRRTDVYGIGAVLFALLTSRPPFVGRRLPDILTEVISATPVVSPASIRPELPEAVTDFCGKCLAKEKTDRFPGIREVRSALEKLSDHGALSSLSEIGRLDIDGHRSRRT